MNTHPLLISGPSGVGKTYLALYLTNNYNCSRIVPTTTRVPRVNETDGVDYHFLTDTEYQKKQSNGKLFMSNCFFNAYYGFEHQSVLSIINRELVPVTEIYTPAIEQFIAAYPT